MASLTTYTQKIKIILRIKLIQTKFRVCDVAISKFQILGQFQLYESNVHKKLKRGHAKGPFLFF